MKEAYSAEIERQMKRFYRSLNERDRRRYAAIEATKLGHGGIEYMARVLGCDTKTVAKGMSELKADEAPDTSGQRKKGGPQKAS